MAAFTEKDKKFKQDTLLFCHLCADSSLSQCSCLYLLSSLMLLVLSLEYSCFCLVAAHYQTDNKSQGVGNVDEVVDK